MTLLGIDVGTTHCKAGLVDESGTLIRTASRPTIRHQNASGNFFYDPEELWQTIASAISEVTRPDSASPMTPSVIGITSMAETGILLDRETGMPRSEMIPWFDTRAMKQFEEIRSQSNALERFSLSGLHLSFKHGLPKILWLEERYPGITSGAVWLSAADYIAFRLTGKYGTDETLAARTYTYHIHQRQRDDAWLRTFGLTSALFPPVLQSGTAVGDIPSEQAERLGLHPGVPVAVSGHDHVCASLALGVTKPGIVMDSMGTAETLVGAFAERSLGESDMQSGLSFGRHVLPGRMFWMGGISSSGGSIEWFRKQAAVTELSYDDLNAMLEKVTEEPTGILYYPFLSGSGAPYPSASATGAFVGLKLSHTTGHLIRAMLEGTAYHIECIRRAAEDITKGDINRIVATGGGTRNLHWMQIKADVSGCPIAMSTVSEAALVGAALVAGLGAGIYRDETEIERVASSSVSGVVNPDQDRHQRYQTMVEGSYLSMLPHILHAADSF